MMARKRKNHRGIVLIIVITVLMALTIIAVPFAVNMRLAKKAATASLREEEARVAAYGAVSYAANMLQASAQAHDSTPLYDPATNEFAVSTHTFLNRDITDSETTIPAERTTGFPDSGYIRIDDEWIRYGGLGADTFNGCLRGMLNTTKAPHRIYAEVSITPENTRWHTEISDEHSRINVNTLTPEGFAHLLRLPLYRFYLDNLPGPSGELPTLPMRVLTDSNMIQVSNINDSGHPTTGIFSDGDPNTIDGFLCIDDEWMAYKDILDLVPNNGSTYFTGVIRGVRGTSRTWHHSGRTVFIEFPLPVASLTDTLEGVPRVGAPPEKSKFGSLDDVDSLTSTRGPDAPPYQILWPASPSPTPEPFIAHGWLRIVNLEATPEPTNEWLTYYRVSPSVGDRDSVLTGVKGGLRPGRVERLRRGLWRTGRPGESLDPPPEHAPGSVVRVPPYPLPTRLTTPQIDESYTGPIEVEDATWFPPQGFINVDGEVMYYSQVRVSQEGSEPLSPGEQSDAWDFKWDFREFELDIARRGLRGTTAIPHSYGAIVYPALCVEQFLAQPFDSIEEMRNPARKVFLESGVVVAADSSVSPPPLQLQDDARRQYFPTPRSGELGVVRLGAELIKYTGVREDSDGNWYLDIFQGGSTWDSGRRGFGTSLSIHSAPATIRYLFTYDYGDEDSVLDTDKHDDDELLLMGNLASDDLLVDLMESIPPAIFDQIRPYVTIATLPEAPREIPVMLSPPAAPDNYTAMMHHDASAPLIPWRARLILPNGEQRLITRFGVGYVNQDADPGIERVLLYDATLFPPTARARLGGREWFNYAATTAASLTGCTGVRGSWRQDSVVPDPLLVSWENAIQWGGEFTLPSEEYQSASLRITNPAKVNINSAHPAAVLATAASTADLQTAGAVAEALWPPPAGHRLKLPRALSLANAAALTQAVVANRPIVDADDLLDLKDQASPPGDQEHASLPQGKASLFLRRFRSAFTVKNKGAFRIEATGTVQGSRRETAASYTTTQIIQVPDIVPSQATTPSPLEIDTQDYFVDWASAKNSLSDGTSHLAIVGANKSYPPASPVPALESVGIPTANTLACAQPGSIPQEDDFNTTFLANFDWGMNLSTDSAAYSADAESRGRITPATDSGLAAFSPTRWLSPEGIICESDGIAYPTSYRYTTDGYRNIEAATDSATIAPLAIEMWVKPSEEWFTTVGTRYLFDLGDEATNRIRLFERTEEDPPGSGSLWSYLHLMVTDALGRTADTRELIAWPAGSPTPAPTPSALLRWDENRWHYIAAVAAGTEPGELAILMADPDPAPLGAVRPRLTPFINSGYYSPTITTLGYAYRVVDVPLDGYCTSVDQDNKKVTFRGYCARKPPYVWDGSGFVSVTSISPSPPDYDASWTLTLASAPSSTRTWRIGVPFAIEDPSGYMPSSRVPDAGDEIVLMAHDQTSSDSGSDPNYNWELSSTLQTTAMGPLTIQGTKLVGRSLWIAAPIDSAPPWWKNPWDWEPWWEHAPKVAKANEITGENASAPSRRRLPDFYFYLGRDAAGDYPAEALIDDVKISRLNTNGHGAPIKNPGRFVFSPLGDTIVLKDATDWPACGWILVGHIEEPRVSLDDWETDIYFYGERNGNELKQIYPDTPWPSGYGWKGNPVTLLSFVDTARALYHSTGAHADELLLNNTAGFPSRGYLEVQGDDLSRSPQKVIGYVAKRDAGSVLIVPKWLRDNEDLGSGVRDQGAYGTEPLANGELPPIPSPVPAPTPAAAPFKIVTRVPVRYWDRFVGFTEETPGAETCEWVKEAAPALVFRARKRLPGSYLEQFTWEYYDPESGTSGPDLPAGIVDYVNVYVELLLDGQRVYHPARGKQLGYFEEPLDTSLSPAAPWAVNRKFDEIEIRVYFDYTAHPDSTYSDPDNAYTSGVCDVAPKIDRFLLYLRQPVSATLVMPGPE